MHSNWIRTTMAATCAIGLALSGCAGGNGSDILAPTLTAGASLASTQVQEAPKFDPAKFVAGVNHPFFPLVPGTVSTFDEAPGPDAEHIVVEVLAEPKSILGIAATVVRDRVYVGGELIEDTFDWYAQDQAGNVWYLGEAVKNYQGGVLVSTKGSWEAGLNGAIGGIQMLAEPEPGAAYYQEYAQGVAEDEARVRRDDIHVDVPYGSFDECVQTLEWTKLEPGHRGYKHYARGVGLVLESSAQGGGKVGRVELVSVGP